jgi:hypothetical protein
MSLPQQDELDRILLDRPGDEIYPRVKHFVDQINTDEALLKDKLVSLILADMGHDLALANSLDSMGEVLEYLAQERQIEKPEFSGEILMRNFSRISKLKLSLEYADLLDLKGDALAAVLKAEIERLWQGEVNSSLMKQLLLNKANAQQAAPQQAGFPPMYSEKKDTKK